MSDYYLLEVIEGVYFVQFKGKTDSLVYTVDQEEAWKTSNPQAAHNMKLSIMRLYNIPLRVIKYSFPNIVKDGLS